MSKPHLRVVQTAIAVTCLAVYWAPARATEPLVDQVEIDGMRGTIFHTAKPWLDLPLNETLRTMRINANCSAMGGPVGSYKVDKKQLLLVELYRCGGAFPLTDVYPDMQAPALATWVTGELQANVGRLLCRKPDGAAVFERTIKLQVAAGMVQSSASQTHTASECSAR